MQIFVIFDEGVVPFLPSFTSKKALFQKRTYRNSTDSTFSRLPNFYDRTPNRLDSTRKQAFRSIGYEHSEKPTDSPKLVRKPPWRTRKTKPFAALAWHFAPDLPPRLKEAYFLKICEDAIHSEQTQTQTFSGKPNRYLCVFS